MTSQDLLGHHNVRTNVKDRLQLGTTIGGDIIHPKSLRFGDLQG